MTFLKFNDFVNKIKLNEKNGDSYDYGCAMLYFTNLKLKEIQSKIKDEDLYIEEGDRTYGKENEPHITLLFGLHHDDINEEEIFKSIFENDIPSTIKLNKISIFENDKYDVLKFDVSDKILTEINNCLRKFPYTNDYDEYNAHSTIAYVKKGKGKIYEQLFEDMVALEVAPNQIVYSRPDGSKSKKMINQNKI